MRKFIRTSSVALVGLAMLAGPLAVPALAGSRPADVPGSASGGPTADSWIVTLAPGTSPTSQAAPLARTVGGRVGHVYTYALHGFQFRGSAAAADALLHNPHVASVAPDYPVYLTETLPNGIERISAYDNDTPASSAYHQGYRGDGARIAIMDTGIDLDHPDLVNALDQGLGKNCVAPASPPNDGYGHGTHVAGTAAAPLNGVGVVGVAPEARLVAVKVFDDAGNSSESLVLCGFDHVLSLNADADPSNDVDVLNMSFGEQRSWGDCVTDPLHTAVCNAYAAGITMVAGAGNSAVNASSFVPAAFDEVIGVSALADFDGAPGGLAGCGFVPDLGWTECDDTFAFFSNYGSSVDVIAPGVAIYSTWAGAGYKTSSGTSMATPHVSGVAALMAALSPSLTPTETRTLLRQSGECPNGTVAGTDGECSGQGTWPDDPDGSPEPMVNALRAAQAVGSPPTPVPPSAPTLSATSATGSVALSWTVPASDGGSPITGYEIYRGTAPGTAASYATVGVVTEYTDTAVSTGTTYYYQVAAVNGVGVGTLSNEVSATPPPPPTVPSAPVLDQAVAGDASVMLSWTAPASDGGSPVTNYQVYRGTSPGSGSPLTTVGNVTEYTDTTVTNGTTYYYTVAAINAAGEGPPSNELSATPQAAPPTVTRTGGSASTFASAYSASGSVAFDLPAGSDRLVAMVSMYTTTVTVSSVTWMPDPADPSQDQALTFVGRRTAPANGAVEIWELANPSPGVSGSAVSHTLSASTKRIMGLHALAGVGNVGTPVGAAANSTAIGVDVASEAGGMVLDVLYGNNSTTGYTAGAGQTERWDTNTTSGLNNLRGAGSEEVGAASVTMSWTAGASTNMALLAVSFNPGDGGPPPDPVVPGAPTLSSATGGNASVALAWTPPASDGGSPLTGYEIWRGTSAGGESLLTTLGNVTAWTDTTVSNGTTYYYQVAAVNSVGSGPRSNELPATPQAPPDPVVPGAPTLTSATGGNASVALAWTPPASDGGSPLTGYEIWRGTTSGGEALHTTVGVQTTYTDTTASNGTTYYYQVAAVNSVGSSPRSNELSATPQAPPDPVAPGAPTLTSATGGNASVALDWTPPASDGGSPLTGYEIWRGTTSGGEALHTTVGVQTTYTDTTASNGTTYYYQVAAVNSVGSSPRSNELSATPQAAPPAVTRTGGTASTFGSAFSTSGSVAFSLPPGSDRLVAMVSLSSTSVQVTSVTWRPNAADPSQDQALTFVGRQTAPAKGSVEIWQLANPTPTVSGSSVDHVLSGNAKRVMGLHALAGAGSVGTPVGAAAYGTTIGVSVASASGGLVLDVLYGNNSTTGYTAGAGQAERWDTNTTGGLNNLRGCGSEEAGAPLVTMSWTAKKATNLALLAVSFTP